MTELQAERPRKNYKADGEMLGSGRTYGFYLQEMRRFKKIA